MKLLKEIKDGESSSSSSVRKAVRIIAFFENKIPLLHVSKQHYHKIPGGGIDEGEEVIAALHREVKEETGGTVEVGQELGMIREYRKQFDQLQDSFCYLGVITSRGNPEFTDEEEENGFKLIWVSLDEAIELLSSDSTQDYEGKFILERDLTFLQEAKKQL